MEEQEEEEEEVEVEEREEEDKDDYNGNKRKHSQESIPTKYLHALYLNVNLNRQILEKASFCKHLFNK